MILLTGSSGFLGQTILQQIGKEKVITLSRHNSDYLISLEEEIPDFTEKIDVVIHSAGKAHSVPKTETEIQKFFDVNVIGTVNLLKGLEKSALPKSFIFISTVAVYGKETGNLIKEDTPLRATDAYGKSKIEAEKIVQEWCKKNNVICTILRLPLIAGPNPPGNLKSMISGIKKGYYFNIAGGIAQKSIVLAEDIAKIILIVSKIGGIYNLTDRHHPSFHELSDHIAEQLHKSKSLSIPLFIAKQMAAAGDLIGSNAPINSQKLKKIISELTFDDGKAVKAFGWNPIPVLEGFQLK